MGKLDTVTVNGPEDEIIDWDAVQWHRVEDDVRRLRQRIVTATQAGDLKRIRNLQKLMLRSRANALLSVRRVTEHTPSAACQTALPVGQYSAAPTDAFWACLTRLPGKRARPVLRGPGAATRRGYPTGSRCSTCSRRTGWIRGWLMPATLNICPVDPRPTSWTPSGCAKWPNGRCCARVSCRPNRSGSCGI